MAEMTSAERVMTVLRRGEPDRIPHFEWIIDKKVRHALCPGASTEEFTVRMGLDAMLTAPDFKTVQVAPNRFKNEWGIVVEKGEEQHSTVVQAAIQTMEDFEKYQPPDAFAPGRFDSLKKLVARYKGKYAIGVHLNDVFSIPRNLMGFEELMMAFAAEPELVRGWWRCRWTSISSWPAKRRGTARISSSPATTTPRRRRPSCRPTRSGNCCIRGLKRVVKGFHDHGLPVIKHTDGNIMPLMDMILDVGVRLPRPDRPAGRHGYGVHEAEVWPPLALKGNVNCATTLVNGTVEEVVRGDAGRDPGRRPKAAD